MTENYTPHDWQVQELRMNDRCNHCDGAKTSDGRYRYFLMVSKATSDDVRETRFPVPSRMLMCANCKNTTWLEDDGNYQPRS